MARAGLSITAGVLGLRYALPKAKCEALKRSDSQKIDVTRLPEPEFCWKSFFDLLAPEIWYILGAIVVSSIRLSVISIILIAYTRDRSTSRTYLSHCYFTSQSALVVAFANIQIPLQLGAVVNALQTCMKEQVDDFWALMKEPAMKLTLTYIVQVSTGSSMSKH